MLNVTKHIAYVLLSCLFVSPVFAGASSSAPMLPSISESLASIHEYNSSLYESSKIDFQQQVLLKIDPIKLQNRTQFAQLKADKKQIIETVDKHAQQPIQIAQAADVNHTQHAKVSTTLSQDLIAITEPEKQELSPAQEYNFMDDEALYEEPQAYAHASNKYLAKWNKIKASQDSHFQRWEKNQRQKSSAEDISALNNSSRSRTLTAKELKKYELKRPTNVYNLAKKLPTINPKPNFNSSAINSASKYPIANYSMINNHQQVQWVTRMMPHLKKRMRSPQKRHQMLSHVYRQAIAHDLKPDLVLAVIQIESNFKPGVDSVVGAQGLMQIMPFWKREIGSVDDNLYDMGTNIRYGCKILRHYLNIENNRLIPALARYNGSYGRDKYPNKVLHAWANNWQHL